MSVAIQSDADESLRDRVEAEYRHEDPDVPDGSEAAPPRTYSYWGYDDCCWWNRTDE